MKTYTAPEEIGDEERTKIFLAGSIEQGKAVDWQADVINRLSWIDVVFFNPRRREWDATLEQSIDNPVFVEQVNWELEQLQKRSNIAFFYFQADTLSPISLLELGLVLNDSSLDGVIVVCEPGFWRRGNIQITCARARVTVLDTLDEGVALLQYQILGEQHDLENSGAR